MQPDDETQISAENQPIPPQQIAPQQIQIIAPQQIAPQQIAPQQIVPQQIASQQIAHPGMQQVVYIPLNYSPEVNFRNWSYLPLGIGITIYLASVFGSVSSSGSDLISMLGTSACCGLFAVAGFLDAAFYRGKSEWQASTGQSNGGSITGMVFDIIFGVIASIIAIWLCAAVLFWA